MFIYEILILILFFPCHAFMYLIKKTYTKIRAAKSLYDVGNKNDTKYKNILFLPHYQVRRITF